MAGAGASGQLLETGAERTGRRGDRERVRQLLDLPPERMLPEAYAFREPVSPTGQPNWTSTVLDPTELQIPNHQGALVVETAGGLMVPLTRTWLQIDQLAQWQLTIVLVARSGLGTLNHTLLSLEALKARQLTVLGLILNGPFMRTTPAPSNSSAMFQCWRNFHRNNRSQQQFWSSFGTSRISALHSDRC